MAGLGVTPGVGSGMEWQVSPPCRGRLRSRLSWAPSRFAEDCFPQPLPGLRSFPPEGLFERGGFWVSDPTSTARDPCEVSSFSFSKMFFKILFHLSCLFLILSGQPGCVCQPRGGGEPVCPGPALPHVSWARSVPAGEPGVAQAPFQRGRL